MTLRAKPWQQILLLVVCCCFVAVGAFLITKGNLRYGWWCVGFFGFCALAASALILPGSSSLQLTPEGMEIYSFYRKTFVRWADVREFSLVSVPYRTIVGWKFVPSYPKHRIGRKLNSVLAGVDAALPSSYGMSAEALCTLLNEWRPSNAGLAGQSRSGNPFAAARN